MTDRKQRYTLEKLIAETEASGTYPLPESEREWIDAPAVGHELLDSGNAAAAGQELKTLIGERIKAGLADKVSAKSIDEIIEGEDTP